MKQSIKLLLGGAFLLSLPMFLTSCEDILGEWSKPTPVNVIVTPDDNGGGASTENTYLVWDATAKQLKSEALPTTYTKMDASQTTWSGTYIVEEDVEITTDVTLSGDATIIIKDGFTLSLSSDKVIKYVDATEYNLSIHSQSAGASAGKLVVSTTSDAAYPIDYYPIAINGTINIYGAAVSTTATGADNQAIFAKNLNIYGANVVSKGSAFGFMVDADLKIYGDAVIETEGGTEAIYSNGGIFIYGGNVKATGKDGTAGGGGANGFFANTAFEISGGTVTAKGGNGATARGGDGISCTLLTISGGKVTTTGGDAGTPGDVDGGNGVGGNVNVTSGSLLATGKAKNASGNDGKGVSGTITFSVPSGKGCADGSSWDVDLTSGNPSSEFFIKIE